MSIERDDVLAIGRAGVVLPQFSVVNNPLVRYDWVGRYIGDWMADLMQLNPEEAPHERFHKHTAAKKLIFPAEGREEAIILESMSRSVNHTSTGEANENDYPDFGLGTGSVEPSTYWVHTRLTRALVLPRGLATDFDNLLTVDEAEHLDGRTMYTTVGVKESEYRQGNNNSIDTAPKRAAVREREDKILHVFQGILERIGYKDTSFALSSLTVEAHERDICSRFDEPRF